MLSYVIFGDLQNALVFVSISYSITHHKLLICNKCIDKNKQTCDMRLCTTINKAGLGCEHGVFTAPKFRNFFNF